MDKHIIFDVDVFVLLWFYFVELKTLTGLRLLAHYLTIKKRGGKASDNNWCDIPYVLNICPVSVCMVNILVELERVRKGGGGPGKQAFALSIFLSLIHLQLGYVFLSTCTLIKAYPALFLSSCNIRSILILK